MNLSTGDYDDISRPTQGQPASGRPTTTAWQQAADDVSRIAPEVYAQVQREEDARKKIATEAQQRAAEDARRKEAITLAVRQFLDSITRHQGDVIRSSIAMLRADEYAEPLRADFTIGTGRMQVITHFNRVEWLVLLAGDFYGNGEFFSVDTEGIWAFQEQVDHDKLGRVWRTHYGFARKNEVDYSGKVGVRRAKIQFHEADNLRQQLDYEAMARRHLVAILLASGAPLPS